MILNDFNESAPSAGQIIDHATWVLLNVQTFLEDWFNLVMHKYAPEA